MARKIPPRRVPRDREQQRAVSSGSIFGGSSIPGAHTHVEADITDLDKYSQVAANAKFVEIAGDTMTGLLLLSAVPVADLGAATKKFVDDHNWLEADITDLGSYLPLSGGTITGSLAVRDAGATDFGTWSHDGTDFNLALTGTNNYSITGLGNLFTVDASMSIPNSSSYRSINNAGNGSIALIGSDTSDRILIDGSSGGTRINAAVGFNGQAPFTKPSITGSRSSNAALASLLTALASYGLITDSSS